MKKPILFLTLFLLGLCTMAQNTINGYQYWFDSDSSMTSVSITSPVDSLNLDTSISVSSLTDGLHTFNIRFLDDSSKYSSVLSQFFFKKPTISVGSNKEIEAYEIWYDNDYTNAINTTITATATLDLNTNLNISSLTTGLHTVNYRCRDNVGNWSSVISQFFFKQPEIQGSGNIQLTTYEIWFDNDFSNRTSTSVTATSTINLSSSVNAQSIAPGLHTLNVRFQDDLGQWSSVVSQFFLKAPESPVTAQQLTAYEYWFNNDYSAVNHVTITGTSSLDLIENLDVTQLPAGLHTISFRFKDDIDKWSPPISQFFFKKPEDILASNDIVLYRYWFDTDDEEMIYQEVSPSQSNFDLIKNFDLTSVWKGLHTIHFQFRAEQGQWSVVTTDTIEKISLPIAQFAYTVEQYCDSVVIQFANESIDGDVYHWSFGDGDSSKEKDPIHTFTNESLVSVSLIAQDTSLTIDSSVSQTITIDFLEKSFDTLYPIACDSFISPSTNHVWTTSGTYYDTLTNQNGCDSLLTVNLTINKTQYQNISETSCFTYTSPSLKYTWTQSGIYKDTLSSVSNCDSVLTIDLTINTVDTSVSQDGKTLTANADNATFQWVDCNNGYALIDGETDSVFIATSTGSYAVIITQENCDLRSDCYTVSNVGVTENTISSNISAYPNPTQGYIRIELNNTCTNLEVEVRDVAGRLISASQLYDTSAFEVYLDGAVGFYYIYLTSDEGKATVKALKE